MSPRLTDPGHRLALTCALLLGAGLRLVHVLQSAPADDAYITYRYARSLASGLGPVYNPGERVLGTTTPLFTILLTPFARLRLPLDVIAPALSILADLAVCLLLFRLLRKRCGAEAALTASFIYALFYAAAAACGYGMETQIFQLLVVAMIVAASGGRLRSAAILAGLAALTRPEGFLAFALLAIVLGVESMRGSRRAWIQPLLLFIAVTAPWYLFATFYFGSPIPNSVWAKSSQADISIRQWAGFFLLRNPILVLLWAASAAGAAWGLARRDRGILLLCGWAILYPLFFAVARPPFLGIWYFPPLAFALAALAGVGAVEAGRRVAGSPRRAAIAAIAGWILLSAATFPRSLQSTRWSREIAEKVYRPMARWVAANAGEDEIVEVSDIGYVGYLSGRRILDSSGLVSPEVWRYKRAHRDDPDSDVAFLLHRRPPILLLPLQKNIYTRFRRGGLLEAYRPVARFQVLGETDLDPPDPGPAYAKSSRYMPDFLAFRRIEAKPSTGPGAVPRP